MLADGLFSALDYKKAAGTLAYSLLNRQSLEQVSARHIVGAQYLFPKQKGLEKSLGQTLALPSAKTFYILSSPDSSSQAACGQGGPGGTYFWPWDPRSAKLPGQKNLHGTVFKAGEPEEGLRPQVPLFFFVSGKAFLSSSLTPRHNAVLLPRCLQRRATLPRAAIFWGRSPARNARLDCSRGAAKTGEQATQRRMGRTDAQPAERPAGKGVRGEGRGERPPSAPALGRRSTLS